MPIPNRHFSPGSNRPINDKPREERQRGSVECLELLDQVLDFSSKTRKSSRKVQS